MLTRCLYLYTIFILYILFILGIHSVEGYSNFVPTDNVCNSQKEAWQTPQTFILMSVCLPLCLSICLSVRTYVS